MTIVNVWQHKTDVPAEHEPLLSLSGGHNKDKEEQKDRNKRRNK